MAPRIRQRPEARSVGKPLARDAWEISFVRNCRRSMRTSSTTSLSVAPQCVASDAFREPSTRIDCAELLKRFHDVDALACPCGGRLKFIALIMDEALLAQFSKAFASPRSRLPSEPPAIARARSPDWLDPIPVDG